MLLRANRMVSVEELVDTVWPEHPPATVRNQIFSAVSLLRGTFAATLGAEAAATISTQPPGYVLRAGQGQIDAESFRALLASADAERAKARIAPAAELLRTALALWRGPVLADVPSASRTPQAQSLADLRLSATEKLVDVELRLGAHATPLANSGSRSEGEFEA